MTGRFDGTRTVVFGAGVAGRGAARALLEEGAEVLVSERGARSDLEGPEELEELEASGARVRTDGHERDDLDGAELVIVSPGIPPSADVFAWARERSIPVWGEMELGARLADAPYLAVTGTNGKTTTTEMLAACLRAGGHDAVACGNVGLPFPTAARGGHDVLAVEVSSFQLVTQTSFHPVVSVLLNLAPDHLDWHGSFQAYADAKARVFAAQMPDEIHVGNRDDPAAEAVSRSAPCRRIWFTTGEPATGEIGYVGGWLTSTLDGVEQLGEVDGERAGYRADAAAAAAAALAFGVPARAAAAGIAGSSPRRHRGEIVANVEGVRFIDNSKATNVHAALAAIDGVDRPVLIAGGRAKGQDLTELGTRADRLAAVVAIGESADEVARVFEGRLPVRRARSIEEAAAVAFELAPPSGVVLLAPACASWDQFRNYEERGERFTAAARSLVAKAG